MIRLAVIGCGSVVQQYHLPALAAVPALQLAGLVDVNPILACVPMADQAGTCTIAISAI